jgi:Cof subfamily protein (haloacid dehalogenase superfamily)
MKVHCKLLAIDLDGTLLDSAGRISDGNMSAVRKAQRSGVRVAVTTGRSFSSAEEYIRLVGPGEPAITYNGALIQNGASVLKRFTLGPGVVQEAVSLFHELGHPPIVYTADGRKFYERIDRYGKDFFSFSKGAETSLTRVVDLAAREWDGVLRVSVITGSEHIPALHLAAAERMGARVRTVDTFFPDWNFWIFEVLDAACSKSNALAFLCAVFGIGREEVIAIGDNDNDIDMLSWAGFGVAMQNALQPVKKAAAYVTEKSNDDDGVAEVIERFILRID